MPIYEFECEDCGTVFEEFLLRKDEEVVCKNCKSKNIKRLISSVAFKTGGKFVSSKEGGCASCKIRNCKGCH